MLSVSAYEECGGASGEMAMIKVEGMTCGSCTSMVTSAGQAEEQVRRRRRQMLRDGTSAPPLPTSTHLCVIRFNPCIISDFLSNCEILNIIIFLLVILNRSPLFAFFWRNLLRMCFYHPHAQKAVQLSKTLSRIFPI